jgi:hypothetical protein
MTDGFPLWAVRNAAIRTGYIDKSPGHTDPKVSPIPWCRRFAGTRGRSSVSPTAAIAVGESAAGKTISRAFPFRQTGGLE